MEFPLKIKTIIIKLDKASLRLVPERVNGAIVFTSLNIKRETGSIQQELMIHIGYKLI
jgi:hypothetical protein